MSARKRILIVDDEQNVRLVFRTTLESSIYEIAEAADGEAALATMREGDFDLVLLDLLMPRLDGMETLRRMRRKGINTPVVVITAHGRVPDAVEAMRLGAIDFLAKPIRPDELRRIVGEVVARHAASLHPSGSAASDPLAPVKRELNKRQFDEAQELLNRASDGEIDLAETHYLRGMLLELRGQSVAARAAYDAALRADPNYQPARARLAASTASEATPEKDD